MNLLKLKYFHAVALNGSFTRAAQELRISQPSLSKMVREFEEELGIKLLSRDTRRVELTPQGQRVFDQATKIFAGVDELAHSLGDITQKVEGTLQIGASDVIASEMIAPILGPLLRRHPNLYPIIQTGSAHALTEMLHERKLDLVLLFHIPDELKDSLSVTRFTTLPFSLVVAKDKVKDRDTLESFIGSREVDALKVKRFPTLEKWRRLYPKASIKISTNSLMAHLSLARAGAGVAVLPTFLVEADLKAGKLVKLMREEDLNFDLKLLRRKNSQPSLNETTFLESLKSL